MNRLGNPFGKMPPFVWGIVILGIAYIFGQAWAIAGLAVEILKAWGVPLL